MVIIEVIVVAQVHAALLDPGIGRRPIEIDRFESGPGCEIDERGDAIQFRAEVRRRFRVD